ncbi:unnamed protein product [Oppiella nova]|uniref:protein-serine/threonine phosphatase n=1 Tax=Oppiella nova TaxID=334625 RepID=A0A7R9L8A4_9ACAR|nr:unnamed protein product [Oppiella nova]CAG2158651.1 unnamed protein product [Oppiella nova]
MAFITIQRNTSIESIHQNMKIKCDSNQQMKYSLVESQTLDSHKSGNECYFAVRGAAIILPHEECIHVYKSLSKNSSTADIQKHLQSMFVLLRPEDTLRMAVKLESIYPNRTRYLIIVSSMSQSREESCLLGIDCNNEASIGLVLPVWADTRITLDGDGGFSITSYERHHIFKPVSVQAMWSALQTLHRVSHKSREHNYFSGGTSHSWISYYEKKVTFDRSAYNEWHAMDDLLNKRPPSPDLRTKPPEQVATEQLIRAKLKEVMMAENLDEVTSKYIRTKIERELGKDLSQYKSFIDEEMLKILGQMDESSQIFDYLYLGSEWNASNFEELKGKGVGKILNVTREIDNFFPGMFDYYNIRVYDDDSTEMLKYWDKTFRYIRKAKDEGSKVLVHCKKGISRSASVVLAFVMKETGWKLDEAFEFVKNKRNCIRPNSGFLRQLEIYQGILDASKQRHNSLWRSKSETNLVSKDICLKRKSNEELANNKNRINKQMNNKNDCNKENSDFGNVLQIPGSVERPKSWSPEDSIFGELFANNKNSNVKEMKNKRSNGRQRFGTDPSCYNIMEAKRSIELKLTETDILDTNKVQNRCSIVKDRIIDFETSQSQSSAMIDTLKGNSSSGLVYSLTNQFESTHHKNVKHKEVMIDLSNIESIQKTGLQSKPPIPKHQSEKLALYPRLEPLESCDKPSKHLSREQVIDLNKYYMKDLSTELSPTLEVVNTRRRLEDNNLKRTNSYDSILKELSLSLFENHCHQWSQHNDSKGHKRSSSLFSHNHNNKGLALPPLTTCRLPSNESSDHTSRQELSHYPRTGRMGIPHSKSMPSVIEAVNEVLCSTSAVMNSLMQSIPNTKAKTKPIYESSQAMQIQSNSNSERRMQSNLSQSLNESILYRNRFSSECESKVYSVTTSKSSTHSSRASKMKDSDGVVKRLTEKIEAKVKGSHSTGSDTTAESETLQHSHSTPSSPNINRNDRPRASTLNESTAEPKTLKPLRKTSFEFPFKRIKSQQSFESEIQTNSFFSSQMSSCFTNKFAKTSKKRSDSELTHKSHSQSHAIHMECSGSTEVVRKAGPKLQQGRSHPLTRLMPMPPNTSKVKNSILCNQLNE